MSDNEKTLAEVIDMLKGRRVAMLTSFDGARLVSRPMGVQDPDDDGTMWFFTETGSDKAEQIRANARVNVTFADGDYLSVEGTAEVLRDEGKQRELWNPFVKSWLQCEPEDPKVSLIKVTPDSIGYWDTPTAVGSLFSMAKGLVTGKQPEGGEHGVVEV